MNEDLEICDNQDAEWEVGSDSSVHTSDNSTSKKQNREQGEEWSALNTSITSVACSEAG